MRIFVSSSFEDLREHRAAAIRVLRQLGHEVLAMEDLVAASAAPLTKVLEMVDRSEAYVGIFAWRYGYVPGRAGDPAALPPPVPMPQVTGATYGQTSITHYEFLRAKQRGIPVMAFLLDEQYPWTPQLIDGFETVRLNAPADAKQIRELRQSLQAERVVSWFTTPSDLEARVSAAVTMARLTSQLNLKSASGLDANAGMPGDSSAEMGIKHSILDAIENIPALKLDLRTTWWSTRLYLIAALAERLTQVRRIVVVKTAVAAAAVGAAAGGASTTSEETQPPERFVGQLSTKSILAVLEARVPALAKFQEALSKRPVAFGDVGREIHEILQEWHAAFGEAPGQHQNEAACTAEVTPELLRRWFGDSMLREPVRIVDLERASVVELLRLLDYPNDYVPVITRHAPAGQGAAREVVDVVDKVALNAWLARNYLTELMDRARIM